MFRHRVLHHPSVPRGHWDNMHNQRIKMSELGAKLSTLIASTD